MKTHIFKTDFFVWVGFRGTYTVSKSSKTPEIDVSQLVLLIKKTFNEKLFLQKSYELLFFLILA